MDDKLNFLIKAKEAYYAGSPLISDLEYDLLEQEWRLENQGVNLQVDAGQIQGVFDQPYLSLKKVDLKELKRFVDSIGKNKLCVLPKLDGVSMEIHLKPLGNGKAELVKALTRGGNNVTEAVRRLVKPFWEIATLDVNHTLVFRGEVYYNKADLEILKELGFANLRNSVAGLLNRKELTDVPENLPKLNFAIWRFMNYKMGSHSNYLNYFRRLGFPTAEVLFDNISLIEMFEKNSSAGTAYQATFDYEIDGLVIFNDVVEDWPSDEGKDVYQNSVAWKFESPSAVSTIKEIKWSLGTTGRMTPVAFVEPVFIAGSTVSNVNLHNHENLFKLRAYPGAKVTVVKANDIIPTIFVPSETSDELLNKDVLPKDCPVCSQTLEVGTNTITCVNLKCDNKITGVMEKWVNNHEWKFFSEEALKDMLPFFKDTMKHPIIRIFDITEEVLNDHMTKGKATRLWKHYLEALDNVKPETLFGSLNIDLVGVRNAKEVLSNITKPHELLTLLKSKIEKGEAYIYEKNLFNWISDNTFVFLDICSVIEKLGVETKKDNKDHKGEVVITGEVPGCSRPEAFSVIESKGYKPSNSLNKTTKFLITENPDSGTSKNQKAQRYGTTLITWRDFLNLP